MEERGKERGREEIDEQMVDQLQNKPVNNPVTPRTATGTQWAEPQNVRVCVCVFNVRLWCVYVAQLLHVCTHMPLSATSEFLPCRRILCVCGRTNRMLWWQRKEAFKGMQTFSQEGKNVVDSLFVETENSNSEGASSQTLQKKGGVGVEGTRKDYTGRHTEQRCCEHLQKQVNKCM